MPLMDGSVAHFDRFPIKLATGNQEQEEKESKKERESENH